MSSCQPCVACGTPQAMMGPEGLCPACLLKSALACDTLDVPPSLPLVNVGSVFGSYEVLAILGRGGMGVVYLAKQVNLNREVALKMVQSPQHATEKELARFRQEAEAAARLNHPNIVPVYEIGEENGLCYFTMKLVEGAESLAVEIQRGPLEPRRAAGLIAKIARAIHYAHQRGVIHRDVKPGNILIDAEGEPTLADFGLAKLQQADMKLTMSDRVIGTPQYMSPEQVSAAGSEVTTATDIYSLGAVLYEALTGRPPFRADSIHEMLRLVAERDPVPPRTLVPELDRDLQTICLKCLEKDPRKRYASANGLADDLENWLAFIPISARPVSLGGRLQKWALRRPGVAALTAAVAVLGGVAMLSMLFAWRQAELRNKSNLDLLRQSLDGFTSKATAHRLKGAPGHRWEALDAVSQAFAITKQLPKSKGNDPLPDLQNEAIACLSLADLRNAERWIHDDIEPAGMNAMSRDFSVHAQARADGRIVVRAFPTGTEMATLPGSGQPVQGFLRFSPDAKRLAAGYGSAEANAHELIVWDLATAEPVMTAPDVCMNACDFTPDGTGILVGTRDSLAVLQISDHASIRRFALRSEPHTVRCSPDGRLAAISYHQGGVSVFHLHEDHPERSFTSCDSAQILAWHPRSRLLGIPDGKGAIWIWDVESEAHTARSWPAHNGMVKEVAWHPNGRHLFSEGSDGLVTMWESRIAKNEVSVAATSLNALHVSVDGRRIGPFHQGTQLQWMEINDGAVVRYGNGHPGSLINSASWNREGTVLATAGEDRVKFWNVDGEQIGALDLQGSRSVLWTEDALIVSGSSGLQRWPIVKDKSTAGHALRFGTMARIDPRIGWEWASITHDGRWLAAVLPPKVVLFDLSGKDPVRELIGPDKAAFVAISPHGNWAAAGTRHGQGVRVWSLPDGRVKDLPVAGSANVGFDLDGKMLITGNGEEYVFWTIDKWKRAHSVPTSLGDFYGAMAFSPRGTAVALESERNRTRIIHAPTLRELISPDFDRQRPLVFSPSGSLLINADAGQHLVIWDIAHLRKELRSAGLDWSLLPDMPEVPLPRIERVEISP